MQRIKKEELLRELESVSPGLSPREIIEQSSCFVFSSGRVATFNDEISCSKETCLDITGAVRAEPVLALLRKLQEEEVRIEMGDGEILIQGKSRKAGIRMESEVRLPTGSVDQPSKWRKLPEEFLDAIKLVQQTSSKDESKFALTCVHIHPEWVEACDNFQATRVTFKTGLKSPILIKKESLKHVTELGMDSFGETDSWAHFRNSDGLVVSCRRYLEEYPNTSKFFEVEGEKVELPKGLAEAADKAAVFTSETKETNQVLVEIRPGKLRVKGEGVHGWFQEVKKVRYKGPALSFLVSPELLAEITKKHAECIISSRFLMVDGGKFKYVSCIGVPSEE